MSLFYLNQPKMFQCESFVLFAEALNLFLCLNERYLVFDATFIHS